MQVGQLFSTSGASVKASLKSGNIVFLCFNLEPHVQGMLGIAPRKFLTSENNDPSMFGSKSELLRFAGLVVGQTKNKVQPEQVTTWSNRPR